MSNFFSSLKADLLDRRLLPLVVVVVIGFALAIGYVVLGGGSNTSTPAGASAGAPATTGLSVSRVTPNKAVAETTGGVSQQRGGKARNPFTPLPEAQEKTSTAKSSAPSSTSSSGSSSSTASEPSSSTPAPSAPPAPPATKTAYHAAILFGLLPPAETPEVEQLTPYENLQLLTPLPSSTQALIVFRGVTAGGKSATFTLVSEAILHGPAKCLPSDSQCEAIELTPGQIETLEYASSGQSLVYELELVSITVSKEASAKVESELRGASKAGRELLKHDGLTEIPGLRYSAKQGVLVLAGHAPFGGGGRRSRGR